MASTHKYLVTYFNNTGNKSRCILDTPYTIYRDQESELCVYHAKQYIGSTEVVESMVAGQLGLREALCVIDVEAE